ncbi:MAG: Tad domain-containing protein [Sneathiella sp.]|nr:Tad domain-containing protein [Sneathiella sp.]
MQFKNILLNTSGSVSIYAALFTIVAVGAGALALDVGRMTLLRAEMQDRADAGAMAAAQFLDGSSGARVTATDVATNSMTQTSGTNNQALTVDTVTFYSSLSPLTVATTDTNAKYISVTLDESNIDFLFAPLLSMLSNSPQSTVGTQSANAIAGPKPFLCHAPPLMICDFLENSPPTDLRDPDNYGRMIVLKEPQGGGGWAPGNFGLLSLPDGSGGASAIEAALAAEVPSDCYSLEVETATGSKTNKIKNGINARFDRPGNSWPFPAPNVINYPRDNDIIADSDVKLGDGNWDIESYWPARHGGATVPAGLQDHNSEQTPRLQVYLYELGKSYWRYGNETIYPIPTSSSLPAGYEEVIPPATDVPVDTSNADDNEFDGVPSQTVASNDAFRRYLQVAQLQCVSDNIRGNGTYPTNGNFIEVLVTEYVPDPPNAAIYGEIIRALTPSNASDYHANVELY